MELQSVLAGQDFGILLAPSHPIRHQIIDCLYLAGICLPPKQVIWKPVMRHTFLEMLPFLIIIILVCVYM